MKPLASVTRGRTAGGRATQAVSQGESDTGSSPAGAPGAPELSGAAGEPSVDLATRRDELMARYAELQCDLGGLVYEMAIRDHIRVDVLVRRAAVRQDVDAELGEIERVPEPGLPSTSGGPGFVAPA